MKATWVEGENDENLNEEKGHILLGGDPSSPTWEDYLSSFTAVGRARVEAVREAYESGGHDFYGEDMNDGYWSFDDGHTLGFSWRGWGDFRQAMENKREGYMKYYMRFA